MKHKHRLEKTNQSFYFSLRIELKSYSDAKKFIQDLEKKGYLKKQDIRLINKHPTKHNTKKKQEKLKYILEQIPFDEEIMIGKVYKKFLCYHFLCYRTFQRYIETLDIQNKIKTRTKKGGNGGSTTFIRKLK